MHFAPSLSPLRLGVCAMLRVALLLLTTIAVHSTEQVTTMCAEPRQVPFVLYGVGGVGSELLRVIISSRKMHAMRYGLHFSAKALFDSSGAVLSKPSEGSSELSDAELEGVLEHKAAGRKLNEFAAPSTASAAPQGESFSAFLKRVSLDCGGANQGCMLVDCTATEDTIPALLLAAESPAYTMVSANKKPFASSLKAFEQLASPKVYPRVRYESTVGAGVPVVASLRRVVASADPVHYVAGSFSGTLGFVMSALQQGEPFSAVVARAKELGYTEPDPRDDLGGVDVARKALILARTIGLPLGMADIAVQPLFPESMATMPVPEFMAKLPSLDAGFEERVKAAQADGKVLRYAASIHVDSAKGTGKLEVGLQTVPADSPLGALQGTDNLVEMTTDVYKAAPLVLRGAGAGVGGTAAGVLADMVELAYTRSH